MFVVVKWVAYSQMQEIKSFADEYEAIDFAKKGVSFEQVDVYKAKDPDNWRLICWKPFGDGMAFMYESRGRKGV